MEIVLVDADAYDVDESNAFAAALVAASTTPSQSPAITSSWIRAAGTVFSAGLAGAARAWGGAASWMAVAPMAVHSLAAMAASRSTCVGERWGSGRGGGSGGGGRQGSACGGESREPALRRLDRVER